VKASGALLLVVIFGVFVGGGFIGFNLLTSSADTTVDAPTCEARTIAEGEELTPNLVTVNAYNASRTAGLANRLSVLLQRRGFLAGTIANNPTDLEVKNVVILTDDPKDPEVRLVASQFGDPIEFVDAPPLSERGVDVLLGADYADRGVRADRKNPVVTTDRDVTVCVPILPVG
jgi:hypothetical protein